MVLRNTYLEILRPHYHDNMTKVIMGVRRCGKSTLLDQIIKELIKDGVNKNNIHLINMDLIGNKKLSNTSLLAKYLGKLFNDGEKHYLLIDEVQYIKDWIKLVNVFNNSNDLSIFVTGSCSNLLDDTILYNYISINMLPFTYKELTDISNKNTLFDDYIKWGSMPLIINQKDNDSKISYINDVYNSIVVRDIVERYNVKDVELLNKIVAYILGTLSIPFSVNSMASFFETYDRKVSLDTMYNYLEYINTTFMINKLERYSLNENRVIYGKYKYYLSDINFINVLDDNHDVDLKYRLENVIYNELVRKGYKVYQGIIGTKFIDFIAFKDDLKVCIEVYDKVTDIKELKSSIRKLNNVDADQKYILSLENIDVYQDSIYHKNIKDFLLNNNL